MNSYVGGGHFCSRKFGFVRKGEVPVHTPKRDMGGGSDSTAARHLVVDRRCRCVIFLPGG